MKKLSLIVALLLVCSVAHATNTSRIKVQGTVDDGSTKFVDTGAMSDSFTTGAIQVQIVQPTVSAYTAISVPTGAKAIMIDVGTVRGLKLKGVSGDVGISLDSVCPVLLPLSADNVTLGFLNTTATTDNTTLYFF